MAGAFSNAFSNGFDVEQLDLVIVAISVFQPGAVAAEVIV
jgi:hypothetical protein